MAGTFLGTGILFSEKDTSMSVGLAIKKAMERAREHERLSTRRLRVRVTTYHGDYEGGLTIRAGCPMRRIG